MTRSGEKLYGDWQREPPEPPRWEMPFWWWVAVAFFTSALVVNLIRGGNW